MLRCEMIIESGEYPDVDVLVKKGDNGALVRQGTHIVAIDPQQATQLIAVLQKWVNGGEVE
jgi:hypothetical protein